MLAFYVSCLHVVEKHSDIHGESTIFGRARPDFGEAGSFDYPDVVLQCSGPHVSRLAEYCREVYPGTKCGVAGLQHRSPDRALLVQLPSELQAATFVRRLTGDADHCLVRRAFVTEPRVFLTWPEAIAQLLELVDVHGPECQPRVQAYPRYFESQVVQEFERASIPLELVRFTHVASLVWVDAMYVVGLVPRGALVGEDALGLDICASAAPKAPTVSRAFAKLNEALDRSGWAAEVASMEPGPSLGVDIGASPGGWSICLASVWRCQEVWAVDPAEMAEGVCSGVVRHLCMKSQEALDELRTAGRMANVLVCDANMPCDQTLDMLESAATLLARRAFIVLTFKNTCKTKQEFDDLKKRQIQRLAVLCTDIREVQLLANKKETTLMARFAG